MPATLDDLANRVAKQQPALLLGAGACIPSGAPTARELATHIVKQVDPTLAASDLPLASIAEVLEVKHGRRPVFEAVKRALQPLQPAGGLKVLPAFPWRAIYSTNYDMLVEKAYNDQHKPLIVVRSDYEYSNVEDQQGTPYFKIHGCMTQDRCIGHKSSMLLTDSDYISPSKYREAVFQRMELDMLGPGLLIMGHSLRDKHLSDLVRQVAMKQRELGLANKLSLLVYTPEPNLAIIFEATNVVVSFGGIDEFMDRLIALSPAPPSDSISAVGADGLSLPTQLISSTLEVRHEVDKTSRADAMFSGRAATYADISQGLTFSRQIETDLTVRLQSTSRAHPIVGVAGVGKTTAARRFLVDQMRNGTRCWEHRKAIPLRVEPWLRVHEALVARREKGVLLIDDVTEEQAQANRLVDRLPHTPVGTGLYVVVTAETSQWVPRQKSREFFRAGDALKMDRLTEFEIAAMVRLVNEVSAIRNLLSEDIRRKSPQEQVRHVVRRSQADMFVCLKALFASESLDDILLTEYARLEDAPQQIYRHVAALEAAGLTVHRQLILRLFPFPITSLGPYLNALEGLVEEYQDRQDEGVFIWATRHPKVAEIISSYKFRDPAQHLDLLRRVIENINPSVALERRFIADLCNAEFGIKRINDCELRIGLYEQLASIDPRNRIPRHRLIREYLDSGQYDAAVAALADAEATITLDPPLQRYKVVLQLERAKNPGLLVEDRVAILRAAREEALRGITRFDDNMYAYFAFDDVARAWRELTGKIDWLEESLEKLRLAYNELMDPKLHEAIWDTESLIRRYG